MASIARRAQRSTNIWPGFVDALATLLMVLVFLLMIFVLAQFFLSDAISGRDSALERLENQVSELADLLALERSSGKDMRANITQLSEELQISVSARETLETALESLAIRAEGAEQEAAGAKARAERVSAELVDAFKTIDADRDTIAVQVRKLAALDQEVAALTALRDDLEKEVTTLSGKLESTEGELKLTAEELETTAAELEAASTDLTATKDKLQTSDQALQKARTALTGEQRISQSARAQVALLNRQMAALREQLKVISAQLDAAEEIAAERKVQIASLGKRLNAALASKVQELSRYRSEFFGRLRQVLGNRPGIRVVGDRFVFQSEVLFSSGSADLGDAGREQMVQLAETLRDIAQTIPAEINWVLRVDGHTDKVPISTPRFPSNWELSAARAISVVKYLLDQGIPASRLAATGFGENQPLDARDDEIALRRNRRIELKLTER